MQLKCKVDTGESRDKNHEVDMDYLCYAKEFAFHFEGDGGTSKVF